MKGHFPLTNIIIGFFLLITIVVMEVKISLQQHCLPKVSSQFGFALTRSQFKNLTTENFPACNAECKKDEGCMSLNYHLITKKCELNKHTGVTMPAHYKKRANSIYSTNTAFRTPEPTLGLSQSIPAKSCLEILNTGNSLGTGEYWIDPGSTGTPMRAYCDMTTDGGGWTVVKRSIFQSLVEWQAVLPFNDITVISEYENSGWVVPKSTAMTDIRNKMGFQQAHYYCHKKSVGRVMSIVTRTDAAGQAVVSGFITGPNLITNPPTACGSFDRLPDDTSILSQNCAQWGTAAAYEYSATPLSNQWGYQNHLGPMRPGLLPICSKVGSTTHFWGASYANDGVGLRYLCDDAYATPAPYTVGDIWQISVR